MATEYTPVIVFMRPATAKTRDWWAGNDEDADPPAAGLTVSAQRNHSNDTFACCQAAPVRDDYFVISDRLHRFGDTAVAIAVRRVDLRTPSAFARKPILQMRPVAYTPSQPRLSRTLPWVHLPPSYDSWVWPPLSAACWL